MRSRVPSSGQPTDSARAGRRAGRPAAAEGGSAARRRPPGGVPAPAGQHLDHAGEHGVGDGRVRAGEQRAQPAAPPGVGQPAEGTAGVGLPVDGDPARQPSTPAAAIPVGHSRRGSTSTPAAAQVGLRRGERLRVDRGVGPGAVCSGRSARKARCPARSRRGRRAGGAGTPSGSPRWRRSRASPAARRPGRRRPWRSGRRRTPTAVRWRSSRPGPAGPRRRRRAP